MNRLAPLFLIAVVACTGDGLSFASDNTLVFDVGLIDVSRYASTCGVQAPPFLPDDLYAIDLVDADARTPKASVDISFHPTVPVGTDIDVAIGPLEVVSSSIGPNGVVGDVVHGQLGTFATPADDATFRWSQGIVPTLIDDAPLDSVSLRVLSLPQVEGGTLGLDVNMRFHDGQVLHFTVRGRLATGFSGCPAG